MSEPLTLETLTDTAATAARMIAADLGVMAVRDKADFFARTARALVGAGLPKSTKVRAFFVPGRIEVLGKHTDYAGGRSMLAAAEKGFCLIAAPRDDGVVRALAVDIDERAEFALGPDLAPTLGHWSNYPMTVARRIARNFPGAGRGADVAFASSLPPAAGMSSSSAMLVGVFLALSSVNDLPNRREWRSNIDGLESLAGYLGTVENGQSFGGLPGDKGVGTFGGSEDHTAMLCCLGGALSQYSYCPVRLERRIAMPQGYVFAVGCCGVEAEKTGKAREKFNRASRLASAVAAAWREATGRDDRHIAAALASDKPVAAAQRMRELLACRDGDGDFTGQQIRDRFEQFFCENEHIIPAAGDALIAGDVARFGELVDRSQHLAEALLGNQIPETMFLARAARECGAAAASAFGAGFGGSVWALVREDQTAGLLDNWRGRYQQTYPEMAAKASFLITHAGPAAFELT